MIETNRNFIGMMLALAAGSILLQPAAKADVLKLIGEPTGYTMGGVYTSPYLIEVNGVTQLLLACDDFTTDISNGQSWQANRITLASAEAGNGKFKTGGVTIPDASGTSTTLHPEYTVAQKYFAAGWLAEQLLAVLSNPNQTVSGQYSFAIWQIFYSGAIDGAYGTHPLSTGDATAVGDLMRTAFSSTATISHNVYLYTPTGVHTGNQIATSQEFIGVGISPTIQHYPVDEASTTMFLAINFLALPLLLSGFRRRFPASR